MISAIVPVYKVEEYLDQCVASIAAQTYPNLEIILVDDGSPDRCGAMCDAWAAKDSRIRVIHQANGGLSAARNTGLQAATGDYISFVDSDDYLAPTMYEALLSRLTQTDSDIAACGVQAVWADGKSAMLTRSGSCTLDAAEAMEAIVTESWLKQPVWYKLYKRHVTDGILFEEGKCHEDVFWSWQAVARAKRVCVFDTPLYFYRQRSGSIMAESFSVKRLDALEAKAAQLEYLKINYPKLAETAQTNLYFFAMYLMQQAIKAPDIGKETRAAVLCYVKKYPAIPKKATEKIWVALAKVSFAGTCKLRNLFGIGI